MTNLSPYYKEFAPPNEIAHLVGAFWSFSMPDKAACNHCVPYRVLPDGCMDLIFCYQRSTNGGIYRPSHQKTEKSASLITSKGFRANVEAEKSPQLSTGIQKEQLFMGRFFRRLADFSR